MHPTSTDPQPTELDPAALQARLTPVLADLSFPCRRWQVVAEADLYGCDGVTRGLVDRLPERTYGSLVDLVVVLAAVLSGRGPRPSLPPTAAPGAVPPPRARRSGVPAAAGALAARRRPARAPAVGR